jgi:glycosyltransferase involved in cell wall biosynthesis
MNPDRPRRRWLRRVADRLAHAYVAVSPALAEVALTNGDCDAKRVCVISNGIDLVRFAPDQKARREVRAELGIPVEASVVCTVGRLSKEKDQALLVEAMAPLLGTGVHLVIVGDGPEREALREQIAGIAAGPYVHMTGPRSDVERVLAAADAFALTSRTEGLPLVLLEAMATALPVIATAVGGIPDLIEPRITGLLVGTGDRQQLTRQLAWVSTDASSSRRMGQAARRHVVARHSVERMAREYEDLYASVLALRGRTAPSTMPVAGY